MCTFMDKEIAEYIRHKQNIFHETYPRSIKRAVSDSEIYPNAVFDTYG